MSAERLRVAATVLRTQAGVVPESPWYAVHLNGKYVYRNPEDYTWVVDSGPSFICDLNGDYEGRADIASYIATMHPGVALALAKSLDEAADAFGHADLCMDCFHPTCLTVGSLLPVADEILGS